MTVDAAPSLRQWHCSRASCLLINAVPHRRADERPSHLYSRAKPQQKQQQQKRRPRARICGSRVWNGARGREEHSRGGGPKASRINQSAGPHLAGRHTGPKGNSQSKPSMGFLCRPCPLGKGQMCSCHLEQCHRPDEGGSVTIAASTL